MTPMTNSSMTTQKVLFWFFVLCAIGLMYAYIVTGGEPYESLRETMEGG